VKSREIPQASWAIIGGSSTNSLQFPRDLGDSRVEILDTELFFATPFGDSPRFTLFEMNGKRVLTCPMHGWRREYTRGQASQQVFWVLKETGVKRIFGEGGVGALNHLLRPRDLIIPLDYIDRSLRSDVSLGLPFLLIMRNPVCPVLHQALVAAAEEKPLRRTFDRGVYVVTDGRHFESRAEIEALRIGPGDIVGQSFCPEVYLAREIGACYAGLYVVVNFAEGVIKDWDYAELGRIFHEDAIQLGSLLLNALDRVEADGRHTCACADLRKPTLLRIE